MHFPARDDPVYALTRAKFGRLFRKGGHARRGLSQAPLGDIDGLETGEQARRDVLIANHQIYTDWAYIWGLMNSIGRAGELKIVMKRSLRALPVLGWSMRMFDFVFLRRKWEQDRVHFQRRLASISGSGADFCLVLFPEGTTLTAETRAKSDVFAMHLGLPALEHVLQPRVLGLWEALRALKGQIDGLFDITLAYEGVTPNTDAECVFSIWQLVYWGHAPRRIHCHLNYLAIKEIPLEDAGEFALWLRERYHHKDRLLEAFYAHSPVDSAAFLFPGAGERICKPLCPRGYFVLNIAIFAVSLAAFHVYAVILRVWIWPALLGLCAYIASLFSRPK
jgi:1-acyl-sn-glycerol-3-phosphate acyltransferase